MRVTTTVLAAMLAAVPAGAQQRQMEFPPDHWLTWDSLTTGLSLTDAQLLDVGEHYEALNAVMKTAAGERATMREAMGGRQGGGAPTESQRTQMMAIRSTMDSLQTQVDKHYSAIRAALTPEQQRKLDGFAKPVVMPRRGGRRP